MQSGVVLMCYYLWDFNTIPDWNNISRRTTNTLFVQPGRWWLGPDDGADKLLKEVRRSQTDDLPLSPCLPPSMSPSDCTENCEIRLEGLNPSIVFYSPLGRCLKLGIIETIPIQLGSGQSFMLRRKRRKFQFNLFQVWCLKFQFEVKGKSQR